MIFAIVSTVGGFVLARAFARKGSSSATPGPSVGPMPAGKPGDERQQLALHSALVGRLAGDVYTPGPGTDPLPTVVLLHGEGDDPAAARLALPTTRPIRLVTLEGSLVDGNGRRRYVDPLLQGQPLRDAQLREANEAALAVIAATQRFAVDGRLVIVGVGSSGAYAIANAMRGAPWFRAALGAGGVVTADWIPDAPAPADAPKIWKLSYGDAVGFDQIAAQKATALGWKFTVDQGDVDVIGLTPDAATVRAWLATHWAELGLAP